MSLELAPDKFEIRDDISNGLILDHNTKLIPIVQEVSLSNVDLTFPDVTKNVQEIGNSGTNSASQQEPGGRSWRAQAWGLRIVAGRQTGSINLAAITAGTAPNLLLGNIKLSRTADPMENVFGPFTKSIRENVWLPATAGRLEYTAWLRRVFWMDIAGGFVRLNWAQSSALYAPNSRDTSEVFWPDMYTHLRVPPAYQVGFSYRRGASGDVLPPSAVSVPSVNSGPQGTLNFASTWRFANINLWLGQI